MGEKRLEIHRARSPFAQRTDRPTDRQRGRAARSLRAALHGAVALGLLALLAAAPGAPLADSKEQMQSLDEQVQEIKSDVLGIAEELSRLEEKLLYPSGTQVAFFVALSESDGFRLDSMRVEIDDELVAHHIYSFKELEALQKGGVQRIYTGNVPAGEHRLAISFAGKLSGDRDFSGGESFAFSKDAQPKLVGITVTGQGIGDPRIELGDW